MTANAPLLLKEEAETAYLFLIFQELLRKLFCGQRHFILQRLRTFIQSDAESERSYTNKQIWNLKIYTAGTLWEILNKLHLK